MTTPVLTLDNVTEVIVIDEVDHGDFRAVHLEIRDAEGRLLSITLMSPYGKGHEVHFRGLRWDVTSDPARLVPVVRFLSEIHKAQLAAQERVNVT